MTKTQPGLRYFGNNAPLLSGSAILPFQANERLIQNDLLQLILTTPGERVMRPTFGCRLREIMFNGNFLDGRDIRPQIIKSVVDSVATWDTRVTVTPSDVIVTIGQEDNTIHVSVRAKMNGTTHVVTVGFGVNVDTHSLTPE